MAKKTTAAVGTIVLLLLAMSMASPGGGQVLPQRETTLKTVAPPAPVITAWGPKDKVATGDVIWFQGTNLKRDLFVATLGDRTIMPHLYFEMIPTSTSTATRIEVRTSSAMKTGIQTSTPLKVMHRGGAAVVLDADYHVVDRAARFSGTSRWHKGNTSSYGIFTEGQVTLVLDNLDFANEGPGTFDEQTRLIDQVNSTSEPCPAPLVLFKKTINYYDWMNLKSQPLRRAITWKRDPAVASRIILYGIGLNKKTNATADLTSGPGLQCGFIANVTGYAPFRREYGCEAPGPQPPIPPAPPAYVVYSLRRGI
jgi:hypothetical protein